MDIAEYLEATGMSLNALSHATRVSYPTLLSAKRFGGKMKVATAERLAEFDPRMKVEDVLGISTRIRAKRAAEARAA